MKAQPEYAPELLALAAVAELGPAARDWATGLRDTYPTVSAHGLARLAIRQHLRLSAAVGVAGVTTGLASEAVELAGVAWVQARLVLRLATAYGQDPTDPERAVELLVLTEVHPTEKAARDAITAATTGEALREYGDKAGDRAADEAVGAVERLISVLSGRGGDWGVRRLAAKLLPGAGVLLALASTTTSTQRLAARAASRYRSSRVQDEPLQPQWSH